MRTLLLWCSLLPALAAGDSARRAAHPDIYALIELARSAPPEFAAQGLLRLLDVHAIPSTDWQRDIAQEALQLARSARHAVPRQLAPGFTLPDSRATLWHSAHRAGLDSLTLSVRALDHLRRLRPEAARIAFGDTPRPVPTPTSCTDTLLDDISAWYRAAARLQLPPLPILQTIQSHGEIAPAIDLIFESRRSLEELDTLAGALAARLAALPQESRAFTAALPAASPKLKHLLNVLQANQRPTAALTDGWRSWIVAGLQAPACEDARTAGPHEQARHDAFVLFNQVVSTPLPPEILKTTGESVQADVGLFSSDAAAQQQAALFRQLLFGKESRALSPAEKDTPEWRDLLQKYMQSIEARSRASDESDLEFFYRTSQLWASVLIASPAGSVRDRALESYISFLLSNAPHTDPLLWYSQLEALAASTRALHGQEFPKMLGALRQTGHPVLQLFAALESAYPSRPTVREN